NQIYTDMDDGTTKMVGGDMLRYAAKCLIEIKKLTGGNRIAILRKHRSLPEERQVGFKIVERGIEEIALPGGEEEKPLPDPAALFPTAYDLGEK
ncbi:TPA: hypothetical protein HA251_01125, partial [Candidatus Woesearchaeota archaeon]|nr:hypothetical protein [Candidatus Woesearchaeota archaeon]